MAASVYPVPPGGVPGQLTMGGGTGEGERNVASQEGGTQLRDVHNIQILYNAEIRGQSSFASFVKGT